jgi:hypothetical protein
MKGHRSFRNGSSKRMTKNKKGRGPMYPLMIRLPPSQKYTIQLRNQVNATSNGSGILAGFLPCDPSATLSATFQSVTQFTEWSSLTALFSQIRCLQYCARFYPATTDEVKGDILPVLAISGNLQLATAPGSYNITADNTDSQIYPFLLDTSGKGRYHSFNHDRKRLEYSSTGTPSSSTIYSGCPGAIQVYASGLPINTVSLTIHIVGTYQLMSRS